MRAPIRAAAAAVMATALAATATACSDFPEGDPNPSTVRVYLDGDFDQTWQLAACTTASDESLAVTGSNTLGERIVIDISGGTGDVTVFEDTTTIGLKGNLEEYEIDEDQVFTAKGDYSLGEESGEIELEGSCATS